MTPESEYINRADGQGYLKVLEYLRQWDPLGVVEEAPDEYDSYAPEIIRKLDAGIEADNLTAYLVNLAEETMGIPCDQMPTSDIAKDLVEFWKK
jgi:hypothetical protein